MATSDDHPFMVCINAVHNCNKDNKCDSCGKPFSEAGSLKKHINSAHIGKKAHKQ